MARRHPAEALGFLEFHAVPDSVRTEQWCSACLAPTGCSVVILAVAVTPLQLRVLARSRTWTCELCGRTASVPEPVRPPR